MNGSMDPTTKPLLQLPLSMAQIDNVLSHRSQEDAYVTRSCHTGFLTHRL